MASPHPGMHVLCPASEETFIKALLCEEGHVLDGPATQTARDHGLSLIRCHAPIGGPGG
jgi:hypothetical protein